MATLSLGPKLMLEGGEAGLARTGGLPFPSLSLQCFVDLYLLLWLTSDFCLVAT